MMNKWGERLPRRRRVSNPTKAKPEVIVTIDIQPGRATPAHRRAWTSWWQKLISEVKGECQN